MSPDQLLHRKFYVQLLLLMAAFATMDSLSGDGILPHLVIERVCKERQNASSHIFKFELNMECQNATAEITGTATEAYYKIARDNSLASLATVMLMAVLSDWFGRKPFLILICIGLCADRVGTALSPNIGWLRGVHSATALLGSRYHFFAIILPALADKSQIAARGARFSCVQGARFIGNFVGTLTGGLLVPKFGLEMGFYSSAVGFCLLALITLLLIKEPLPPRKRTPVNISCCSRRSICFTLETAINDDKEDETLFSGEHGVVRYSNKRSCIFLSPLGALITLLQSFQWVAVTAMLFFYTFSISSFNFIFCIYAKYQFQWGALEAGLFLSLRLLFASVGTGIISPCISWSDQAKVILGATVGTLLYGSMSFFAKDWMFFTCIILTCLAAPASPALKASASKITQHTKQGLNQGSLAALEVAVGIVTPATVTPAFHWLLTNHFSSYVFVLISAGYCLMGFVASMCYPQKKVDSKVGKEFEISTDSAN